MKYGQIICDPTSEEAKNLVGKTIIASNIFTDIMGPKWFGKGTLLAINIGDVYPFRVGDPSAPNEFTFIREVIEEKPKYRPYEDTDEMITDFCERFGFENNKYSVPVIWLMAPHGTKILITAFSSTGDRVRITDVDVESMDEIFNGYTYLDGSPVGKEIEE